MRGFVGTCRHGMRVLAVLALPATAVALPTPSVTDLSNDEAQGQQSPPPAAPQDPPAEAQVRPAPAPSANPLWGIPLKHLSNTRNRPIFSPSRRPPSPPVVATPVAVVPPPPEPKLPEQPNLVLLGTIVNGEDGYAIFMDQAKKTPVRVQVGSSYNGWLLHGIKSGIVSLKRAMDSAILALPRRSGDHAAGLLGRLTAVPISASPLQFPQPNPPFGSASPSQ